MRATHRLCVASSLVLTLLAATVGLAEAQQGAAPGAARIVNRRMDITRPGSYVLGSSIEIGAGQTGINVLADDVTIDLAGFTIKGPGGSGTIGIDVRGATNVTVRNGSLAGVGIGVSLTDAVNAVVEGLQIHAADRGGAPPNVEIGILLVNSRGVRVIDNVITDVFLGIFVRGGGSGGNRIAGNTVTGGQQGALGICYNPAPGGGPAGPKGDLVYNNLVSHFDRGIALSAESTGNAIVENTVAAFDAAIEETAPGSNVIDGNRMADLVP
jgi:parallel beta-helix repeat protein